MRASAKIFHVSVSCLSNLWFQQSIDTATQPPKTLAANSRTKQEKTGAPGKGVGGMPKVGLTTSSCSERSHAFTHFLVGQEYIYNLDTFGPLGGLTGSIGLLEASQFENKSLYFEVRKKAGTCIDRL